MQRINDAEVKPKRFGAIAPICIASVNNELLHPGVILIPHITLRAWVVGSRLDATEFHEDLCQTTPMSAVFSESPA